MRRAYFCELCGQEFADYGECIDHEEAHIKPVYGGVVPINYDASSKYPGVLHVKMANNAVVKYACAGIVDYGDEKARRIRGGGRNDERN